MESLPTTIKGLNSKLVGRDRKAEKILAILSDFYRTNLDDLFCLDIGCSNGQITLRLSRNFKQIIGIEIEERILFEVLNNPEYQWSNASFAQANGISLPFDKDSFDVIICAQVYEHVENQTGLADEVWRILRPGGFCFFSGPNRLAIIEEHYFLPFLSWLPRSWATMYMKIFQKGNYYDAYPLYYKQINTLWHRFKIHDYTYKLLRDPKHYSVDDRVKGSKIINLIPLQLLRFLTPLYPNYNWILQKPF